MTQVVVDDRRTARVLLVLSGETDYCQQYSTGHDHPVTDLVRRQSFTQAL